MAVGLILELAFDHGIQWKPSVETSNPETLSFGGGWNGKKTSMSFDVQFGMVRSERI